MRFNPALFNRLLGASGSRQGLGQRVLWHPALLCPCTNPESGAADPRCPVCGGRGVTWQAPRDAWTGVVGLKQAREWSKHTPWESGDTALTIPGDSPLWAAGEYDRVTMVESTEPFRARVTRAAPRLLLQHRGGTISRAYTMAGEGKARALADLPLPTISPAGDVVWPDGDGPEKADAAVVVEGRYHPELFIFRDLPQDRSHQGGLPLPRRVVARRLDLFARGGKTGP